MVSTRVEVFAVDNMGSRQLITSPTVFLCVGSELQEPTEPRKQPIITRYLGHVTGSANQGPVFSGSIGFW